MQVDLHQQPMTPLTQALQSDSTVGAEWGYDFDRDTRARTLLEEIQRRQTYRKDTGQFSFRYVLEIAAYRYFELLTVELRDLRGFLTESELVALMKTTTSPVWEWRAGWFTLADIVAADNGIESLEDDTPIVRFVRKLSTLTQSQCLALVDCCERIWRDLGTGSDSLASSAERCGLHLAKS